jgi:hypothetical protein
MAWKFARSSQVVNDFKLNDCRLILVCVRGSDKPLDLTLVIDSSDSIDAVFHEQITFVVERIIQNINVHPEAVRLVSFLCLFNS